MATAVHDKGCVSICPQHSSTSNVYSVHEHCPVDSHYFLFHFMR